MIDGVNFEQSRFALCKLRKVHARTNWDVCSVRIQLNKLEDTFRVYHGGKNAKSLICMTILESATVT